MKDPSKEIYGKSMQGKVLKSSFCVLHNVADSMGLSTFV